MSVQSGIYYQIHEHTKPGILAPFSRGLTFSVKLQLLQLNIPGVYWRLRFVVGAVLTRVAGIRLLFVGAVVVMLFLLGSRFVGVKWWW